MVPLIRKAAPPSVLLKRAGNIAKDSAEPNRNKVGKVTRKQVEEIAKTKLPDLNTTSLDSAVRTVMGTARNMGLEVEGEEKRWLGNLEKILPRRARRSKRVPTSLHER